jgi:hypothetical protein
MNMNPFRKTLVAIAAATLGATVLASTASDALAEEIAAPAAQSTAPTVEGSYKGVLVCARFPEQREVLRVPLDLIVTGKSVKFSRPIENGRSVVGSEMGDGTIDGDTVQLSSSGTSLGAHFDGKYSVVITTNGGTLTGVQSWAMSGITRTRPCTGAFVKSL